MNQEIWGLRVHEGYKVLQVHQGNQDAGDGLAAMVLEGCQAKQGRRVTVVLMAWLGCLGKRDTGVILVPQVLREPQVKMGKGVMTEKLDLEVSLANLVPVVCLDQRDLRGHQDLRALLGWTDKPALRGLWVLKVSLDRQVNREVQALRVFLVLKVQSEPQEKKVPWENLAFLVCLEQTVPRAILAKKGLLVRRGARVQLVLRVQLGIPVHVE